MKRPTLDFGIDLGTTNSAVAVLKGVIPEIIKNNNDADITPSAVSLDRKGTLLVGQRARNRALEYPEDSYLEFKRQMGMHHTYRFGASGLTRTPEELSAEVLKALKADVQHRTGELMEGCVVTVPAAFELHQCDATRKAAQLAGFVQCPLLQEPVAAALAHGFQTENEKAYWLVYDFGGGTFDAALIKAEDGAIHVVNHGGDNFLGGSDIDWAIVEQLLAPRLAREIGVENFRRGNPLWKQAMALLKHKAEEAKVALSRAESTVLEARLDNHHGSQVEFECELTRGEIIRIAEPLILRSVDICKRVLRERNLGPQAIQQVILVGGPTLAPYFRELLLDQLKIQINHSVDPLTVVARGAAIFAGTQRFQTRRSPSITAGQFLIDLKYKPIGTDTEPLIGGHVSESSMTDFTGYAVEFTHTKTLWRGGRVPLGNDGKFLTSLCAERGSQNIYSIELHDPAGLVLPATPKTLIYTVGAVVEEQPITNSIGFALANNEYDRVFGKGQGLPAKASRTYRTTFALHQGQSGELLKIPVVEGENEKADRNRLVGSLDIGAESVRRDVPAGSEIEVTIRADESRILTVTAYMPLLDEEFVSKLDVHRESVDPDFLQRDFDLEMRRLAETKRKSGIERSAEIQEIISTFEESPLLEEVRASLAAAHGDTGASQKCEKRLLELKLHLDKAIDDLEWPTLVSEAMETLSRLEERLSNHGTLAQTQRKTNLATDLHEILHQRKPEALRKKIRQLEFLEFEILASLPAFWIAQLRHLEQERHRAKDAYRFNRLLEQGRDCLARNNEIGLQSVVRQLWELIPADILNAVQRGYQSGLIR